MPFWGEGKVTEVDLNWWWESKRVGIQFSSFSKISAADMYLLNEFILFEFI